MNGLIDLRRKMDRLKAEYNHAIRTVKEEKITLEKAKQKEADVAEAQTLVQGIAEKVQATAHAQISKMVSKCLETVFDEPYQFKINFVQKRGKTEAELVFVKDSHELDPIEETEQGVTDVAAFALQLTSLMLARPPKRRLLCLDEPFRNLHGAVWRERIRGLIESLAEEMGMQFIIFTQCDSDLAIDKTVNLESV